MIKLAILGSIALLAAQPTKPTPKADSYAVIINDKNPCKDNGTAAQATIKKLFLKQMTKWQDGTAAKPYGRKAGSAEKAAFQKSVLGMGESEVARHWLKMKNLDGTTPPKGVNSDRMVVKYVAKHKGGFGVVKLDTAKKSKGIKILYTF